MQICAICNVVNVYSVQCANSCDLQFNKCAMFTLFNVCNICVKALCDVQPVCAMCSCANREKQMENHECKCSLCVFCKPIQRSMHTNPT